jgi:Tfp pilus assembly protein PilX
MLRCESDKQNGLALIVAVIFLQVITILGLYAVESAIQAEKMSRLNTDQNKVFVNAEEVLNLIEAKIMKEIPHCLIPLTASYELMTKPLEWWQSPERCAGIFQFFEYYYVVEKLGVEVCINIASLEKTVVKDSVGEYFRITLLGFDKKNASREMLQSTIITLDNALQPCDSGHRIVLGRQMWRELR